MERLLGPVLYARPDDEEHWSFDIGVLLSGDAKSKPGCDVVLQHDIKGATVSGPIVAADFSRPGLSRGVFWRWSVRLKRGAKETFARYRVRPAKGELVLGLDEQLTVVVPAKGSPPRLLFLSCNGFSETKYMSRVEEPFGPWVKVFRQHKLSAGMKLDEGELTTADQGWQKSAKANPNLRGGYHAMIGGGDQLYADSLWFTVPKLDELRMTPKKNRPQWKPPTDFADTMLKAFIDLYALRWNQPEFSAVLARVPGVFTWDDHDVFDGWGSYADELQDCRAYRIVFDAAATAFDAFQLGGEGRALCPFESKHRLQALSFESGASGVDIVLLDLRSDRNLHHVMSEQQWDDLDTWLVNWRKRVTGPRQLLVVSSIPLVHMRFSAWQEELGTFAELDDDMRDQWESPLHRGERSRLIMRLLARTNLAQVQATILSGDVHVAARGRIGSRNPAHLNAGQNEVFIEQLTSSGIIHPAPLAWESLVMRIAGRESDDDIDPFVTTKLLSVGNNRYLLERNWLSIDFDIFSELDGGELNRMWAQYWGEVSGAIEPQVVIDALAAAVPRAKGAAGKKKGGK